MPQLDVTTFMPQVVWLVITFAVLFLVMWKAVVPRIGGVLEARQSRIDDNLGRAADFKKEAEAALAAYEKAMDEARAQAHTVIAEAAARVAEEAGRREAELAQTLAARIAESEAEIARARDEALADVRAMTVELTGAAVDRLAGETPDDTTLSRAVDDAMKARPGAAEG